MRFGGGIWQKNFLPLDRLSLRWNICRARSNFISATPICGLVGKENSTGRVLHCRERCNGIGRRQSGGRFGGCVIANGCPNHKRPVMPGSQSGAGDSVQRSGDCQLSHSDRQLAGNNRASEAHSCFPCGGARAGANENNMKKPSPKFGPLVLRGGMRFFRAACSASISGATSAARMWWSWSRTRQKCFPMRRP